MANEAISRADVNGLVPDEVSSEIITGVRKVSQAMSFFRRLPNMSTNKMSQPVLSLLPIADFVNGDMGLKAVSRAAWESKQLVVGEIAVIIPIPEAVLDDSAYDIWAEIMPLATEAFGRTFDKQVFQGGNAKAPAAWPLGLIPLAKAAGNLVALKTGVDIAEDFNQLFGKLEQESYDVSGVVSHHSTKTELRGLRGTDNAFIFSLPQAATPAQIYGVPINFVDADNWDRSEAIAVAGQWNHGVYSMRQDMTIKVLTESVINDEAGKIVYNLAQQDEIAA